MCFQKNHKNLLYLWENAKNKCFRNKNQPFSFSHTQTFTISLMNKNVAQRFTPISV